MKVLVCNAYSSRNAGDGLLVELTDRLLREALGDVLDMSLCASDPGSFQQYPRAFEPFRGRGRPVKAFLGLAALLLPVAVVRRWLVTPDLARALRDADLVVSVGGGYLRGHSLTATITSLAVHLSQMRLAGAGRAPWVAMPQSVGPYPPPVWRIVRRVLGRARLFYVRDDLSHRELDGLAKIHRVPDLALLHLPPLPTNLQEPPVRKSADDTVGVVLRELHRPAEYEARLGDLFSGPPTETSSWEPLIQSAHSGNDDRPFTQRWLGRAGSTLMESLRRTSPPRATLSVRLHGALQSIHAGVPAVHLTYERKGFAAYSDMGLDHFVHSARHMDASLVTRQLTSLLTDASPYWAALAQRRVALEAARADVAAAVRRAARWSVVQ